MISLKWMLGIFGVLLLAAVLFWLRSGDTVNPSAAQNPPPAPSASPSAIASPESETPDPSSQEAPSPKARAGEASETAPPSDGTGPVVGRPAPKTSTTYVVNRIKPRLDKLSGLDTLVACPHTVALVVGGRFSCDVFGTPAGTGDPVARVSVQIRNQNGYFTWKSQSLG